MLSAAAYSFRMKSRLAISPGWVSGYVNVVTLLYCGTMTSHVTGNVTHIAQSIASPDHSGLLYFSFLCICFFAGAMISALFTETARLAGRRSKYIAPMAVQGLLLCGVWICLIFTLNEALSMSRPMLYLSTGLASMAMGLQNATITRISGAVARTTHLTGVITDLGTETVQLFLWWRRKLFRDRPDRAGRVFRISRRHPSAMRLALLASIFGSFLFGAVIGTWMYYNLIWLSLAPPVLFLSWIIVEDYRRPIADVRELDLLGDSELRMIGMVKSLLPPEIGLYRLAHQGTDARHERPNFSGWVERLPAKSRVLVLAVSPFTRIDADSVEDLQNAVEQLLAQSRKLILAGVTAPQYRALEEHGALKFMDTEDLCPDLEFAIARALDEFQQTAPTRAGPV